MTQILENCSKNVRNIIGLPKFNSDLSNWDVSSVTNMYRTFQHFSYSVLITLRFGVIYVLVTPQ